VYVIEDAAGSAWRLDIYGAMNSSDTFTAIMDERIDSVDSTYNYHVPETAGALPRWVKVVPTKVSGTGAISVYAQSSGN
jgi:hypothetical protein